ncbi:MULTISPECIES: transketolase-like TK C-terminal-containing protein [Streptomyces]|uniref:transketolase-like TK C-terminal-containing protein n=1 Tax=Streptomyces TaxID=1883 RepID=UPI00345C27C6
MNALRVNSLQMPEAPPAQGSDGAARGGYILAEALDADPGAAAPDVVLVASGGEVPAALDARRILQRDGIATRVVSMPCAAWFRQQSRAYRDTVLPPGAPATVSVGAGAEMGRYELLGAAAEYDRGLLDHAGLTPERVAATARATLARGAGAGRAARAGERWPR